MQNGSQPTNKIGDILIQCGMVTPSEMEEALILARQSHLRLGEALVKLGVLGEDQLTWALGIQFDLSHIELTDQAVDWNLLMELPIEQLQGMMVLPLVAKDNTQRVVIADPTIVGVRELVEELFPGRQVLVQLASAHEMDEVFEEVGRRRHRAFQAGLNTPWTPPPGNALLRWILRLESGRIERVVVVPASNHEYAAVTHPCVGENEERLSSGEMKTTLGHLFDHLTCESLAPSAIVGLRMLNRAAGAAHAVRALALEGISGHLLALEGVSSSSTLPRKSRRRITALDGRDPVGVKAILLEEIAAIAGDKSAAPPLVVSLESRVDFLADGTIQVELWNPAVRIAVGRRLIPIARPDILVLEVESDEALATLPVEFSGLVSRHFFVIPRDTPRKAQPADIPDGIDRVSIPPDPAASREQIRALLRGPAATG